MEIFSHPLFGLLITFMTFEIGKIIYSKTKIPIFNPLLVSIILVVSILVAFDIPLEAYDRGGSVLSLFLGPVTIILAVPLYKQIHLLKAQFVPILIGVSVGSAVAVLSVITLGRLVGLDELLLLSMSPKSITTPIAMGLSNNIGGVQAITVGCVVITGVTGAVIAPMVCKFFKIKNEMARGIAIGTSSHAVGTSKAIEMGEVEGAMSGLAIGLSGIATIVILPIILKFLL